jgi:hypothetical protein
MNASRRAGSTAADAVVADTVKPPVERETRASHHPAGAHDVDVRRTVPRARETITQKALIFPGAEA